MCKLSCTEDVSQVLDEGEDVDVIYLDFKKAFDKVPHRRLIVKLQGYGIKGDILDWIKEFLTERKQRVVIGGSESEWSDHVSSGIPQGSVLGPALFLVYINDMPDVIDVLIKLFADDAKIYNRVKQNEQADNNSIQSSLRAGNQSSGKDAENFVASFRRRNKYLDIVPDIVTGLFYVYLMLYIPDFLLRKQSAAQTRKIADLHDFLGMPFVWKSNMAAIFINEI